MSKISDIKVGMRAINTEGYIIGVGEKRTVNLKTGGQNEVADATLGDETGTITLALWGADIAKVKVGARVKITNGYVNTYQGKTSLAIGKFGKLEVA